jgi:hypothetical protein
MEAVSIPTGVWADYFRSIELHHRHVLVTVTPLPDRLDGEDHGAPVGRRLRSIRYDPERDIVELGVGGGAQRGPALRYFIAAPRLILVEPAGDTTEIVIEGAHGERTAIGLRHIARQRGALARMA